MPLSCRFPSTGPNKFAMRLLGATTDWNLIQLYRLWPLYNNLWFCPGRHTGLVVPYTNPQQLSSGASLVCITSANNSRFLQDNQFWFIFLIKNPQFSEIIFCTWFDIMHNWGTTLCLNLNMRSWYLQGYANLFKKIHRASSLSKTIPL